MLSFASSTRRPAYARTAIAFAVVLLCASVRVAPAGASNLCISMSGGAGQVAGLQLDLKWDGNCMSADPGPGTGGQCTAESSTGKAVSTSVMAGPTMRALFFSMSDTNPVPDGNLFCCKFTRSAKAANTCCNLTIGNVHGSSSGGTKPDAAFTLLASMDGQPCTASEGSGGQQQPPVRSGLQGGGGSSAPAVSGGAPAAGGPQAPAAGQPAAPSGGGRAGGPAVGGITGVPPANVPVPVPAGEVPVGNIPEGEAPAGMDQVQRALQQLTPREAATAAARPTTPRADGTPQRTPAAGTPTAKTRGTDVAGTPTAKAVTTPSPATTAEATTPGPTANATAQPTPHAKQKRKRHKE